LSIVGIQPAPESNNIWSPVTCRRRNPATGTRHWPPDSSQTPAKPTGYDRVLSLIGLDPEVSVRNPAILAGSVQTFLPESSDSDRTLPDSGDISQTLIFSF
jgi:hypothetical protein